MYEAVLLVKNPQGRPCEVKLWLLLVSQQRLKNLHPTPFVVIANDLGLVKINPIFLVALNVEPELCMKISHGCARACFDFKQH